VLLLVLAGCGGNDNDDNDATARVTKGQLAAMVLPQRDLGPLARGLVVGDDSGRTSNRETAEGTPDPRDSGRTLARAGRIDGYRASFGGGGLVAESDRGAFAVATEVELFRDEGAASAYLRKQIDDLERERGKTRQGVKVAAIERFEVDDVGEEAHGLAATFAIRDRAWFGTFVAFRRGRVVGSAFVALKREREIGDQVERLAQKLDDRIQRVAEGTLPVGPEDERAADAYEVPDPKALALVDRDFGLRMSPTHQGYLRAGALRGYLREYEAAGARLGSSTIFYLRTLGAVAESVRAAKSEHKYFASDAGRVAIARRFLRGFYRGTGFTPRNVATRALPAQAKGSAGFQLFHDAPKGRVELVMVRATRGRFVTSVAVMGLDDAVFAKDVRALQRKLRASLSRY
jgi:hypothetical protein